MQEENKAIVSNRIYFKAPNSTYLNEVIDKLTYKIEVSGATRNKKVVKHFEFIKNYKLLGNNIVSVPQGRFDLVPTGYKLVDKRVTHEVPFPQTKMTLRDSQEPVYSEVTDSCFINAKVGWGKTVTALHIAKKLGQKTLVIVHNTFLRDQWVEKVVDLFGIAPGIIGSQQYDIEDHFIVVGNIQSLIKYKTELSKEFGTIILDEAHHVPAETFADFLDSMYSRYRIALSGTMERTDGKHVIFNDYFGPHIIRPPQAHTINPKVKILNTGLKLATGVTWVQKINSLLYDPDYQDFIAGVAQAQLLHGHAVLIVADRVEFLKAIKEKIGETCVLITGETPFDQRKELLSKVEKEECMCIAGSRQIFSEGISVDRLSCVILAVPTANLINLEQIVGRIMRKHDNKSIPVVIDINFNSGAEKRQQGIRYGFYANQGWEIESY